MRRYALLGSPIETSLSPALHHAGFRAAGVEADYSLWPTRLDELPERIAQARVQLDGFNLTQPLKRLILPALDGISERAQRCASANTVRVVGGQLIGDNTDLLGLTVSLQRLRPAPGPTLVLGSGGVVGAVLEAVSSLSTAELMLCARNEAAAEGWARRHPSEPTIIPWAERERAVSAAATVVQATPVGAEGERIVAALPSAALLDLVVRPGGTTAMVAAAEKQGLPALDGLLMLVEQAAEAQRVWGLPAASVEAVRAEYDRRRGRQGSV